MYTVFEEATIDSADFTIEAADAQALADGELVVRDEVLGPERASAIAVHLARLEPRLAPAALGRERRVTSVVRGDQTLWLDPTDREPLVHLWSLVEKASAALRETCWIGIEEAEMQLAHYAGRGERYERHCDALAGRGRRRATLIYYLNTGWRPEHGGALRVHPPSGPRDVEPTSDRAVLFLSDRLEHEVQPTFAPRWAVTAWLLGPR